MLRWRLVALLALVLAFVVGGPAALILLGGLTVLVAAHEGGHWLVARRAGVEPTEFAVGMGPVVYQRGRFSMRLLPIGGYVRFAEGAALEEAPPGRRFAVAAAGPAASVVAGFVLLVVAFGALGFPIRTGETVGAAGGLRAGDQVVSVDGVPLPGVVSFSGRHEVVVEREGATSTVTVDGDTLREVLVVKTGRFGPVDAVARAGEATGRTIANVTRSLAGIPAAIVASLSGPGETGEGLGTPSQVTAEIEYAGSALGAGGVLMLLGLLSIAVGVFNTVPLPPLDGGHMLIAAAEGIGGRLARRRVQVPVRVVAGCTAVVVVFLVALMALSVLVDVGRLL